MNRPNVLLILTDQQRPDTMGHRGETPCRTPNIDSLAADGVSFENAYTPCPLCLPARASLFTGKYPSENDMLSNQTGYLKSCEMLDHFRAEGYQINYAGKWHMGEGNIGEFTDNHAGDSTKIYSKWCLDQGLIDGWMFNDPVTRTTRTPSMSIPKVHRQGLPVEKTNEGYVTDFAIDMIRNRDRSKPFFQVCSFNGPHPPFMIPEPYFSMYDPKDVLLPKNFGPQEGEHQAHSESFYRQLFLDHGEDFDAWRASYAVYWGFVTMIDDFIGKLLEVLNKQDLLDDTIIVFTSDHGENLGAHGLWQKMVPFDESIRIPLVLRVPGKTFPEEAVTPVSLVDVAPTIANLCNLSNREWSGRDVLKDELSETKHPAIYGMHRPIGDWMNVTDWRMVMEGGLKYVWHNEMKEELFDLNSDPSECTNVIEDSAFENQRDEMRIQLGRFLEKTNDPILAQWKSQINSGIEDSF